MSSNRPNTLLTGLAAAGLVGVSGVFFASCDGGSGGGTTGDQTQIASPSLINVEYGRLVDVFAYRRIDTTNAERRDSRNRMPFLIQRNVVIDADVETDELFDAIGGERLSANYRFLPFNTAVGHDELLILWDDRDPIEGQRFKDAMTGATQNLESVPASFRSQNTAIRPIPVVPRNAAIKLTFNRELGIASTFFDANPGALQLLRFIDDPASVSPQQAFLPARFRALVSDNAVIVDTTLIGGEAFGRAGSTGLEPSGDNQTANFRIAIPTDGVAARGLSVDEDVIPELNDVDSDGNPAVIRDFRSGNIADGRIAALAYLSAPTIVGQFDMGITAVDPATNTLTINKRGNLVAIRGRIPFVDGAIQPATGLPGGRSTVPTVNATQQREPLAEGDVIIQTVVSSTGEAVTLRAEVIENLDVGRALDDQTFPAPGLNVAGNDDGDNPIARVRVSSVTASDSNGEQVTFVANAANPEGADCLARTHYYENVPYSGEFGVSASVSDTARRELFVLVDPPQMTGPVPLVASSASLGLRFSEPMDISALDTLGNYLYSTEDIHVGLFDEVVDIPKSAALGFLPSRVVDQENDGTVLKLLAPLGHYHQQGSNELYWFHVALDGVRDLSGNGLDIFDRRPPGQAQVDIRRGAFPSVSPETVEVPLQNFSVQFEMEPTQESNLVGSRVFRFEAGDEDGTLDGSIDLFGQFRLIDGRLIAAETTRFSAVCDGTQLAGVERFAKGECVVGGFTAPNGFAGGVGAGFPYQTPSAVQVNNDPNGPPTATFNVNVAQRLHGGIAEPHVRRGSRTMLTYREDDFGLAMHDASQFNIDVEQLHWAPWNNQPAYFDEFDRYSILLAHSDKRPDLLFFNNALNGDVCDLDCNSLFSGLNETYDANILNGSQAERVVDRVNYVVRPALAFSTGNVTFVPYAQFERTYTWRDSRLLSWDMANDEPIGLGGALDAETLAPNGDRTASVSSPWCPDDPANSVDGDLTPWEPTVGFVRDQADFLGDRTRDHDPIALPLLVDIRNFPDDTVSAATSGNLFHIGYLGPTYVNPPLAPGGYYNAGPGYTVAGDDNTRTGCTFIDYPFYRIHSTGGIDLNTGRDILVFPDDQANASGGVITDIGLGRLPHDGLYRTKPGDGHVYWAQADFIRRVSVVTGGFFDTRQPNRHALESSLPGLAPSGAGRPDFSTLDVGVTDFVALLDPPISEQVGGTSVKLEIRGCRQIGAAGTVPALYDQTNDDNPETRGNLLNPNYACEAYRYSLAQGSRTGATTPRVAASGFTPYVALEDLDSIRDNQTGQLPRFLNFRLVMVNNTSSTPTVSPSLSGMAISFRMSERN